MNVNEHISKAWKWCGIAWTLIVTAWIADAVWPPLAIPLVIAMFGCMGQMMRYALKARKT